MNNGFIHAACAAPPLRVADCRYNQAQIVAAAHKAAAQGAELLCFPELCITGYTCEDLFFQSSLLNGALDALHGILEQTAALPLLIAVGIPLSVQGKLYNCAAVLQNGRILGIVPKSFLPNYQEFYEQRRFAPAPAQLQTISVLEQQVPFGTRLLFVCAQMPEVQVAVELCEDLWALTPPSVQHAGAGAVIVLNLSASSELAGKAQYRRSLIAAHSARCLCAYLYADAGEGESSTDLVFAGHHLIAENGTILAENRPFDGTMLMTSIDFERLLSERRKNTSFLHHTIQDYQQATFSVDTSSQRLLRTVPAYPFLPAPDDQAAFCEEALEIQAHGLKKRLLHTNATTAVIGISGGLDSTLALLVTVRAFAHMGKPLSDLVAVTMPCFGTSARTKSNASLLCEALGVALREIPIAHTVCSSFSDIGHSVDCHDVTFENTQARVRTLVLMNLANQSGGLVIGTGDLSELALGWATYNGDHMSMYSVNASIPKTMVRCMVQAVAQSASSKLRAVLTDILNTPVSPELLPVQNSGMSQQTEQLVGPYELHDFFLYHVLRWGFSPQKIFFLAQHAFANTYADDILKHWLCSFYKRFFSQQFKRSCLPDGPKVALLSLSPRGDWRMPSDACCALWLEQAESL